MALGIKVLVVHLPVCQVTEVGENHVRNSTKVKTYFIAAKLHEDQFFSPDVSWPTHHQSFLLEK